MADDGSASRLSTPRWRRWPSHARRALDAGVDLVFPPVCACCQAPLEGGASEAFCLDCRTTLVDSRPGCRRCGAPSGAGDAGGCPHCAQAGFQFRGTVRLGSYAGLLRSVTLLTKRRENRSLATALGGLLAAAARERLHDWRPDVVVPVPMHWMRRVWRGTNGPEAIAARIAAELGVPLRPELLTRRRRTRPQASLSPHQRRANVRGAFRAASHRDLPGACVLLVDDIMTTGATLHEAAKTLARAGVAEVFVAVVARAED